jgi:hypothetical protein
MARLQTALYFLHIPKTAGTTFRTLLESRFRPEEVCPVYGRPDLVDLAPGALDGYRLYRGHLGFLLPALVAQPLTVLTLLREPVSLVVSMYHFVRRLPHHPVYPIIERERLSLDEFLRHPDCVHYVTNPQTFHLALLDQTWDQRAVELTRAGPEKWIQTRREAVEGLQGEAARAAVARARERLDAMAFVGVCERMNESVRLLCHTLDWEPFAEVPRLNVSADRPAPEQLSPSTRRLIEQSTPLDAELYDHARRLFEARLKRSRGPRLWSLLGRVCRRWSLK